MSEPSQRILPCVRHSPNEVAGTWRIIDRVNGLGKKTEEATMTAIRNHFGSPWVIRRAWELYEAEEDRIEQIVGKNEQRFRKNGQRRIRDRMKP